MSETADFEVDVVVVGTGPMGAAAALALATYGVRVHVVTYGNWLADTPRAHITNQRTVEVFRDLGVEDEAAKYATPWQLMAEMTFMTSLAGHELLRARVLGNGDDRISDYLQGSPCPYMDLPQLYLEPVLLKNAAARGASVSFNTEYLAHVQDERGVTAHLQDRLSGRRYGVRAKYLIGGDGAHSKVAEQLGLPFEGHLARAATAYVRFKADLARYVAHRPGIIHWFVTPAASYGEIGLGMLRVIRPWHTWIAGWGHDMSAGEPDFSEPVVLEKIRSFVGDPDLEIDIEATSTWYVNQAYATCYSVGRVFCGGDAVHRHPPSSGLGSNTSIQDAFNLAWKLAYVIQGYADESLLQTYSAERAPVGKQVVLRANQSRLDYAALNEAFRATGEADPVAASVAKLRDPSPHGVAARQALMRAVESKQDEFNSQGVDMNQRYASTAILAEPGAGEEQWLRDPEVYLQATTRPGAKIPHAWLVDERGHRLSTLDVTGKGQFSLLTGLAGAAWAAAAKKLSLPYLRTVVTGEPGSADPYFAWARVREIHEAGALLVRPDGHVAWRQMQAVWDEEEALRQLRDALSDILGKPIGRTSPAGRPEKAGAASIFST